jgi:PAS domain S-box-containing protein
VTPFNEPAPRRVVIAHTDIMMRKLAELALQEANDTLEQRVAERTAELQEEKGRIEAILDNSFDGIVLVNGALHIQRTNRAFDRLFLYDLLASPQKSLLDLIDADNRERVRAIMHSVVNEQTDLQFESYALRSDDSIFEAEISVGYVTGDGLVCTIRDITERNRTQAALAEERNLLRTVIDAVPEYIYMKDMKHRFVLSNMAHTLARGEAHPTR